MKYKIYHIKGVKIGVSIKPKKRVKKQGYNNYEILEEHLDVYEVSDREIQLQREYGYPVDKLPYWRTLKIVTKEGMSKGGKVTGKNNAKSGHMAKICKLGGATGCIPIRQYTKSGKFIKEFISQSEASSLLNINLGNLSSHLKGKLKTTGGFVFEYANKLTC